MFSASRITVSYTHLDVYKRQATDREVEAACRAAGCDGFIQKLEHGYDTPIGENGAFLSGEMCIRDRFCTTSALQQ